MSETPHFSPQPHCTSCGGEQIEPGFVEDRGESSGGYARWVSGQLERGVFGGAKRVGRPRMAVDGWRCASCGHLDLYAVRT